MKRIKRALRVVCVTALAIVLLAFALVHFQQSLLRWRAERLMADIHRIRLYQSNWADAQRLMYRWGAWGHYDGSCTSKDCRYAIDLKDVSLQEYEKEQAGAGSWLWDHPAAEVIYRWLGGRYAGIHCSFIVQDDTIWRTETSVSIAASPKVLSKDFWGYVLFVQARSQQALRESEGGGDVEGDDDQLAYHPFFKVGQPNGCEGCIWVGITYSTHTPQAEIERLTDFELSCLTNLISCERPDELLSVAREWNRIISRLRFHNLPASHVTFQFGRSVATPYQCLPLMQSRRLSRKIQTIKRNCLRSNPYPKLKLKRPVSGSLSNSKESKLGSQGRWSMLVHI